MTSAIYQEQCKLAPALRHVFGRWIMAQIPVIWWAQMFVNHVAWLFEYSPPIDFVSERETPTNAYSVRSGEKNNCPQLFSANSSLRVFSKFWQYYLLF